MIRSLNITKDTQKIILDTCWGLGLLDSTATYDKVSKLTGKDRVSLSKWASARRKKELKRESGVISHARPESFSKDQQRMLLEHCWSCGFLNGTANYDWVGKIVGKNRVSLSKWCSARRKKEGKPRKTRKRARESTSAPSRPRKKKKKSAASPYESQAIKKEATITRDHIFEYASHSVKMEEDIPNLFTPEICKRGGTLFDYYHEIDLFLLQMDLVRPNFDLNNLLNRLSIAPPLLKYEFGSLLVKPTLKFESSVSEPRVKQEIDFQTLSSATLEIVGNSYGQTDYKSPDNIALVAMLAGTTAEVVKQYYRWKEGQEIP